MKRVVLSSALQYDDFITNTETKKLCREVSFPSYDKSLLKFLPQDVLLQIRIICGLDHDEFKQAVSCLQDHSRSGKPNQIWEIENIDFLIDWLLHWY
nr:F-box protein At1g61340-like [Ipomoea batatas]